MNSVPQMTAFGIRDSGFGFREETAKTLFGVSSRTPKPETRFPNPESRISSFIGFVVAVLAVAAASAFAEQASPRVAFLGIWDRSGPVLSQASAQEGLAVVTVRPEDLVADKTPEEAAKSLGGVAVLYVLNVNTDKGSSVQKGLEQARKDNPKLRVIALDNRDFHATMLAAGLMEKDPAVRAYWRANGVLNMRRLLAYTRVKYLGEPGKIEPPIDVPESGFYVPEQPDQPLADFAAVKKLPSWREGSPVAAILIHQSFWVTQDTKVINAEIDALRRRGMNVVTAFASSTAQFEGFLKDIKPNLLIEDRHSAASWSVVGGKRFLQQLDVPYLRPISMLGQSIDEWLANPRGLATRDISSFLSLQECAGTIEPIVVGGLKASIAGYRLHEPIGERVERFADRAQALLRLRQTPNAQKKVAIIYYNKTLGKDDLMRGSPTGAFLNGPESLVRFLPRMKDRGFDVQNAPATAKELIALIQDRGRNLGPWAQGEVEAAADKPGAVLVPLDTYLKWFNSKIPESLRQQVIQRHGLPPGRLMVVTRNGQPHILIPTIRMGNILLTPQPERGEKMDEALLHSRDVPPPHNYLAFYWWLQEEFKADVVVHWGTHGSLELLPGKDNGLCATDWPDVCVGTLPVVNLWIMDNIGESTLARRRSYATLVDHVVPPATSTGFTTEQRALADDIDKFQTLQEGLVRQEFRRTITQAAVGQRIHETLKIELDKTGLLSDKQIESVEFYIHQLYSTHTPTSLHILGQPPEAAMMPNYLVKILRRSFLDRLAVEFPPPADQASPAKRVTWLEKRAEAFVKEYVLSSDTDATPAKQRRNGEDADGTSATRAGKMPATHADGTSASHTPPASLAGDVAFAKDIAARLNDTGVEIDNLLLALEGRYIPPGPGPDPIRNPASVPPGRNLYALNPEEIPTKASWEVGMRLVDELLAKGPMKKIAVDLSGMSTMQDYGVTEAEILYLIGCRPVWDANNLCIDVKIIPAAELKRPRVDVFLPMGGHYRENFGSRIKLLDKAIRMVKDLDEPGNDLRAGCLELQTRLEKQGMPADKARDLSAARIFGTKPGNLTGTNILDLVPRSGVWDNEDQITSVYIDNMSYVYTGDVWGQKIDGLYEQAIQGTDTIIRVWASNLTSQLSNHHCYEYLGGMSMAVKKLTGKEPRALIADVRDPTAARVRDFREVLDSNLRSELLNPAWIAGMKKHDYAGAGHMAELVKNTFGWSVTRKSDVSDGAWKDIYQTYVQDKNKLGLKEWFERVNPHAIQEIAAAMLEASRKGYWNAAPTEIQTLAELYADSVARHGLSSGVISGGNEKLRDLVAQRLASAPGKEALAKAMLAAIAQSAGQTKAPDQGKVYGSALQAAPAPTAPAAGVMDSATKLWPYGMGVVVAVLFAFGFWRRSGAAR